jgi:two-component system cell cycle sensor histidine kinase/response regulator CckA
LPAPPTPGATLLVAEADSPVRTFLCRVLEGRGFRVLAASDGQEALRLAQEHCPRIDVLLTDFSLPSLNGIELAMAVRDMTPAVRVVLMSGILHGNGPGVAYLRKPFTTTALFETLAKFFQASTTHQL